jgi:hypothetical protein
MTLLGTRVKISTIFENAIKISKLTLVFSTYSISLKMSEYDHIIIFLQESREVMEESDSAESTGPDQLHEEKQQQHHDDEEHDLVEDEAGYRDHEEEDEEEVDHRVEDSGLGSASERTTLSEDRESPGLSVIERARRLQGKIDKVEYLYFQFFQAVFSV